MSKKLELKNIGSVSVVFGTTMLFSALSSFLLARNLSQEAFGQFVLMRTLVLFMAPLFVWGQDIAAARFFSKNDPTVYNWKQSWLQTLKISIPLTMIGVTVANVIYDLSLFAVVAVFITVFAFSNSIFLSNIVRSQQKYNAAVFMLTGFRAFFLIVVLLLMVFHATSSLPAIAGYFGLISGFAVFNVLYTTKNIPSGKRPVPPDMRKSGLWLMGTQISVTAMGSMDSLFLPGLLNVSSLALYQASLLPSQIFNIIGKAGKYVWVPEFGKKKKINLKFPLLLFMSISIILLIALFFSAQHVLDFLYKGKYNDGVRVLQIFAFTGAVRLLYNVFSSVIVGRLKQAAIQWHFITNAALMLVYIATLYFCIQMWGVVGAAVATFLLTVLRTLSSMTIVLCFRSKSDYEKD